MSAQRKPSTPPGGRSSGRSSGRNNGAKRAPQKRERSLGGRIVKWFVVTGLAGIILAALGFAYVYASTDIPNPNRDFQAQTTFVYYADGKHELGRFATQNRVSIPLSEVPQHVQDAVVAAENRTFWEDRGIDPKGILRAAFSNATSESTQGASTITQQYVKVLYLSQERTMSRKFKEAFLSLKLHNERSKEEILQGYLNTIYFGRGAYGIQAAAQAYFHKDAKDLNVREGAVLASILNSPGNMDPADGADARTRLEDRYHYVLHGMAAMGALDSSVADKAAEKLPKFPKTKVQDSLGGPKGFLLALVKQKLREEGLSDAEIEGGGLRVTTTFTRKAQRAAVQAVKEERPTVNAKDVNIALAAVEPGTGALRAMYGGKDYVKDQRNWALTGRQPGSTFKPFALAAGLMNDISLFDTFEGDVYTFPDGREVGNEHGEKYGPVNMLTATEKSINTAYVDMTMKMDNGPQQVIDAAVAAGIPRKAPGLKPDPTITLGTADVKPVDLASAYATFANQGKRDDWYVIQKVADENGNVLRRHKQKEKRAFPEDVNSNVVYAQEQVVKAGTGLAARDLGCPAAGKTGTANLRPDTPGVTSAWFAGYTPKLSASVMYVKGKGGTENLDGVGGQTDFFGAGYPTKTWTAFMQKALAGEDCTSFPPVDYVNGQPTPTYTPTPTPTEEPSPTETPTPSEKPKHTPKPKQVPTPTPTPTQEPTPTDGPTIFPPQESSSPTSGPGNGNGNGNGSP
ncbi:MAG TPA: transglycosylase domain-containing protein [Nocardioidaceae bacterium]|nr:transglycosylase domain-containing protein [Nocardioidaceae bacterium]